MIRFKLSFYKLVFIMLVYEEFISSPLLKLNPRRLINNYQQQSSRYAHGYVLVVWKPLIQSTLCLWTGKNQILKNKNQEHGKPNARTLALCLKNANGLDLFTPINIVTLTCANAKNPHQY